MPMLSFSPVRPRHRSAALVFSRTLALALMFVASLSAAPLALPGVVAAEAAAPAAGEKEGAFTVESVAARRVALQKEMAATRDELAKLPEGVSGDAARWLTQETALLERLDAIHADQQRTAQHAADLAKEGAEIEERTRNRRPPETTFKPPFGLALLDELYAEREYLEQAGGWLKTDVANAEAMVNEARETWQEKERARRAARELSATGAGEDAGKNQSALRLAELESRLADETVRLRERALKTLRLQQSLIEPKQVLLRPRFDWLRAHLSFAPEELAAAEQKRAKRLVELDRAIAAAKKEAEAVTQTVIATERRGAADKNGDELSSRRADRQTANLGLSVLTAQRERLAEAAGVAEMRRRVLGGGMTTKELRALAGENQEALDQLARERKRQGAELIKSRNELQDAQGRQSRAAASDEASPAWSLERAKRLSVWIALSEAELGDLDRLRTARARLKEEIGARVNLFSLRDATARVREGALAAWSHEVFSVEDQPVRVRTILAVLLLVVLGYRASRWVSALASRTVFKRMGLTTGRRAAWETLWFYALFIGVLVVAFGLFHISLTQFSVVSGALAVGIGFGSQNLIGNFISGIILLIERPVNQGDVIEIDGRQVTVERLGPRSTIVRSVDNTHIVVPNSRLLEQPVVNWTLSDDIVRKRICVGVAYDSPTRRVAELLQGVLASVESVKTTPAPIVKFADFGENSLMFELYLWVSISEPKDAENELRHRIAEVFAREKIVMAFPQRDVHLETTAPLQVVMVSSEQTAKAAVTTEAEAGPRNQ